jgi:hypothetical protein
VNAQVPDSAALTVKTFKYTATLEAGSNTIEVSATDLAKNITTVKRTVTFDNLKPTLAITEPN